MQDCYDLLMVNKALILRKVTNKEWDEANVDAYIKTCYDEIVKKEVEIPREVALDNITDELELKERLQFLEQKKKLYDEAYKKVGRGPDRENYAEAAYLNEKAHFEQVKNATANATAQEKFNKLKKEYDRIRQEAEIQKEEQANKYNKFRKKYQQRTKRTPYKILNIQKENFEKLSFKEKARELKDKKEILLKNASTLLNQNQDFMNRAEINLRMNEIAEAYEQLNLQIKESRYDHAKEYQPDLIKGMLENNNSIDNKIVIRQKNRETENDNPIDENMYNGERHLTDEKRRNLRVKTIAQIGYQNTFDKKGWLYQYQITRRINGEDKSDIVTSPVSVADILLDKRIGKEGAIDLYNFLANKLFSEETIKGAQKNAGFIGSIKQDEEGNYCLTLDQNQLDPEEQEMLAATIICREKERQKNEEGR